MNKTSQMMTYNIPFLGIEITSSTIRARAQEKVDSKVPGSVQLEINSPNISKLYIRLDERYNTIHVPKTTLSKQESEIIHQLKLKLNQLKLTDVSYGNIETDSEIEYEPTKNIMLKDFINFLKIENRESILENILENSNEK